MDENGFNSNQNVADLLELALRLATSPDDSRSQNAQLLPGRLPDRLPVEVPIPEESHILGSLIRNPESINILLDTHLSVEQILLFYKDRMEAAGWQSPDPYRPNRGGFMPSSSRSRGYEIFYQDLYDPSLWGDESNRNRTGPALTVNVFTGKGDLTDLRLSLEMNGPFPPGASPHLRRHASRNIFSSLPALEAPEGANQIGGGGRGSRNSAHAEATLETNIDLSTLAAHYRKQLGQAGCVLTEEGQHGSLAWNTWRLEEDNEQWHGFLFILKSSEQEYYLHVRMKNDNEGKVGA